MKKTILTIVLAFILALAAGCGAGKPAPTPPAAGTGVTAGKTAPALGLTGLDGKAHALPEAGKLTVINFWATWCPPCREELPELDKFAKAHAGDLAFCAVNLQEPADKVQGFLKQNGYSLPVLLDGEGTVARAWRVNAIPTTVVIDKKGVVRFRKTGPVTAAELEGVIKGL